MDAKNLMKTLKHKRTIPRFAYSDRTVFLKKGKNYFFCVNFAYASSRASLFRFPIARAGTPK